MASLLPSDKDDQVYVTVKPIVAGNLYLPHREVFQDAVQTTRDLGGRVPVICFLVTHPTKGNVLFDLGVRKHAKGYPPHLKEMIFEYFDTKCEVDMLENLAKGGVKPQDIDTIILSHLHWDHTGDATLFPTAKIVVGDEAKGPLAERAYPLIPDGNIMELPKGRDIDYIDFAPSVSRPVVTPFATFERAVDYFGDGSFYLVDAPGHFPGHFSGVARVAPDAFAFLAADLCHNRQVYEGGKRFPSELNNDDVVTATITAKKLIKLNKECPNVVVILAHEPERLEEGMPLFPNDIRNWVVKEVEKRKADKA